MSSQQTPSITKRAFARGIAQSLQRQGYTHMPDTEHVKLAASYAASRMTEEPAAGALSETQCRSVTNDIISFANQLQRNGKFASAGTHGAVFNTENEVIGDMLYPLVQFARKKIASMGPTNVEMNGMQNSSANAAQFDDIAAREHMQRPPEYANVDPGMTNMEVPPAGHRGEMQPHPGREGSDGASTNSLEKDAAESPWFRAALGQDKQAMPTNVEMNGMQNSSANAAQFDDIAARENMQRPPEYANVGQGNTNINEAPAAVTGVEMAHPGQEGSDGSATNSAVAASKHAQRKQAMYRETFQELLPYFPSNMTQEQRFTLTKRAMDFEASDFEILKQELASRKASTARDLVNSVIG